MQTSGRSLKSGFAWTAAGSVVNGLSSWVILTLIARFTTPAVVGEYALAFAVASPVAMLTHLNLRAVIATDVEHRHPFADYLAVRVRAGIAGLAGIAAIAFTGYEGATALAILLMGVALTAENFEDLYYAVMQSRDRMDEIAKSMMLRTVLAAGAVAVLMPLFRSALAAVAAFLAARLGTLFLYDMRVAAPEHGTRTAHREVFRAALPLGLVLMMVSLTANIPRYVIEAELGPSGLGVFAVAASFVAIGSTLMNAVGQSATTRLARAFAGGDRAAFRKLTLGVAGAGLLCGLCGVAIAWAAGDFFLGAIYGAEYAEHRMLLVQMLSAGTLIYAGAGLGFVVTSTRRFRSQLPLAVAVAAASWAASSVAVPRMGLAGAPVALASAALVQICGQLYILRGDL